MKTYFVSYKVIGFAISAILVTAAIVYRNLGLLSIVLVVLLPAYIFIILLSISKIDTPIRTLISISTSALSSAIVFEIDGASGTIPSIVEVWYVFVHFALVIIGTIYIYKSILNILHKNKKGLLLSLFPVILIISCVCISVVIWNTELDYYWRLSRYTTIVQLIKKGQLVPDSFGRVELPKGYENLTYYHQADIINDDTNWSVFFPVFSDIGYLYSQTGNPPQRLIRYCKEIKGHKSWFSCRDPD